MITTADFTYIKTKKELVADASDLQMKYIDDTITISSIITGANVNFKLAKVLRDSEGDVEGWKYIPADGPLPNLLYITILND